MTLNRILPFINGIHSVSHIAQLADTDLSLTRKAIQHLVYYGCLILLDIFTFGAVYAPTAEMGWFVTDSNVQEECARYVRMPTIGVRNGGPVGNEGEKSRESISSEPSQRSNTPRSPANPNPQTPFDALEPPHAPKISSETLITLYASLRQGLPLRIWVVDNLPLLNGIDIRRFITFGVIKGIIYRVHKYAITTSSHAFTSPPSLSQSHSPGLIPTSVHRDSDSTIRGHANTHTPLRRLSHKASLASTVNAFTTPIAHEGARIEGLENDQEREGLPLVKFLDGMHCFDEICTELELPEEAVERKIKAMGEVQIVYR